MEVRRARINDVPKLAVLFDAYRIFYKKPSALEEGKAFLKARIELDESVIFCVFLDGEMLGFTQLYPLFSSTRMSKLWLLNDLFVVKKARGKQLGMALLKAAQDFTVSSGACALTLETEKTNKEGNQLYLKMGFSLDDEHNYYYWENV